MSPAAPDPREAGAFRSHPRSLEDTRFAYAVVSRRAGGISIGINLNPDKACNFDCVYCQVDRTVAGRDRTVDLDVMETELRRLLALARDGSLCASPRFRDAPPRYRRAVDIAFSGDGEPTSFRPFAAAVRRALAARDDAGMDELKLRLITNAAGLDRADVREGVRLIAANNGEVWAKLDAGTPGYYRRVCRSAVPFDRILRNIETTAKEHSAVIQSLFLETQGTGPAPDEIAAYVERLDAIVRGGGRIPWVQITTIARPPAESWATPLPRSRLEAIAERVRAIGLRADVYAGPDESV